MSFKTNHSSNNYKLIHGALLAKNTVWNLLGQGAPLLLAIFAIPILIKGMGTARFGVLTLAWIVIGYFSLFDLGLGRALTKLVADHIGAGNEQEMPSIVWTALALMLILGIIGTFGVSFLSPRLVHDVLKIPAELQDETLSAFYLLAVSISVVIVTAGLRGLLEAYQRFGLINAIRIPMGLFTFLGPLLVLHFSQSLYIIVAVLVAGRVAACLIHLLLCFRIIPYLRNNITFQRAAVKPLLTFGSWMTVTNIVGPLMVYMDRFLIGTMLSVTAVAYYATPFEIITKLWIIPGAMFGVLFPAFATSLMQDGRRTARLFGRGVNYVFLALFPIILLVVTFAKEGLTLWLGEEFAANSSFVLQWLAVGVFMNSLAQIAFGLVQGAGRPDLTAKLHIVELIFYFPVLIWLVDTYGIKGAAVAWVGRVVVDTVLLFLIAKRLLPETTPFIRHNAMSVVLALLFFISGGSISGLVLKIVFVFFLLMAFAFAGWFFILAPEERRVIHNWLKKVVHQLS